MVRVKVFFEEILLEILLLMPIALCILRQYCTFHGVVMNKSELVKALADQANISLDEATLVVNTFVDSMKESLRAAVWKSVGSAASK